MTEKVEIAPRLSADGKWFIRYKNQLWHQCDDDTARYVRSSAGDHEGIVCSCGAEPPPEVTLVFKLNWRKG